MEIAVVGGAPVLRRELVAWLVGQGFSVGGGESLADVDAAPVAICLVDDEEDLACCADRAGLVIAVAYAPPACLRARAEELGLVLVDSADSPLAIRDHLDPRRGKPTER